MSKRLISQIMEQKCDVCGNTKVWEMIGADQNPTILAEMQAWYQTGRKAVVDGQLVQLSMDSCCVECQAAAGVKLSVIPQPEEPADNIDLASLRAAQTPSVN